MGNHKERALEAQDTACDWCSRLDDRVREAPGLCEGCLWSLGFEANLPWTCARCHTDRDPDHMNPSLCNRCASGAGW